MDTETVLMMLLEVKDMNQPYNWDAMATVFANIMVDLSTKLSPTDLFQLMAFGVMAFERYQIAEALFRLQNFAPEAALNPGIS